MSGDSYSPPDFFCRRHPRPAFLRTRRDIAQLLKVLPKAVVWAVLVHVAHDRRQAFVGALAALGSVHVVIEEGAAVRGDLVDQATAGLEKDAMVVGSPARHE